MDKITTYFKVLLEFNQSRIFYIRIAKVRAVLFGIVAHRFLQCLCYSNVVNDKTTRLACKNTVDSGYCLHEIMAGHRFVNVHSRQ